MTRKVRIATKIRYAHFLAMTRKFANNRHCEACEQSERNEAIQITRIQKAKNINDPIENQDSEFNKLFFKIKNHKFTFSPQFYTFITFFIDKRHKFCFNSTALYQSKF